MPRVNVYIRKEDEQIWAGIEDKPEWLHKALQSEKIVPGEVLLPRVKAADKAGLLNKGKSFDLCKHGAVKGMCKRGCK